ncbi:MAG: hypothetical protein C0620_00680 [Desulfuromonas sp.]|nr:MAG: hypothetical protein C0620_00680 [Desulfuromonas sp.]
MFYDKILSAVVVMLLLPTLVCAEESLWTLRGRSESEIAWQEVKGRSDSTMDEGTTWRQELSLNLSRTLKNGQMGLDIRGRATNNEQIDNRDARLLYLHGYWQTPQWNLELGDVAGTYNPLVFTSSVKGIKLAYKTGDHDHGWEHTLIGGLQKPTWEQLYDYKSDESVDRYIAGFNTSWQYAPAQTLGATLSYVKDDASTVQGGDLAMAAVEAQTAGVDWNWRFNRYLTLRGETAMTHSDDNLTNHDAGAIRLKIVTKPIPRAVRSTFFYERLDTEFKPIIASASSDRERFENDTEWMISRELKLRITLKHSHDNLDGAKEDTLVTRDGVVYLEYRPDWLKRADFGLRSQFKRNVGSGADQDMQICELDFNYRPTSGWRYGLGWIFTNIDEHVVTSEDQRINTLRGTIGWKKRFANDHMFRSTIRLDGHFVNKDSGDQESVGGSIDLGYDAGDLWSTDFTASTKDSYNDESTDNSYTSYQFRANYHPGSDRSKAIRLTAERREYDSEGSDTDQDYQEHLVKLAYLVSF